MGSMRFIEQQINHPLFLQPLHITTNNISTDKLKIHTTKSSLQLLLCHQKTTFKIKPQAVASSSSSSSSSSSRENELPHPPLIKRKSGTRVRRHLITIGTSDRRWHEKRTNDYVFSLEELSLADLAEDGQKDAEVSVSLTVQKHAGFGFSVDGRINTSFTRKCSNCSSSYCREIDTSFDVWVLPSPKSNRPSQLPEIGGDDPDVIYVKPGCQADLDSLVRDTIRLTASVQETCSESCEKAEPKLHYICAKEEQNTRISTDGRWSKLLELKKKL